MASTEGICRDVGHIYSRLFDHRAALQGQQRFFVKEFETKRGFRECKRLEQIQTTSKLCSGKLSQEPITSLQLQVELYDVKVDELAKSLNSAMLGRNIDSIEKGCGKEKLSEEWQQFNDNLSEKRRQFDADLDDKMAAARKRLEELRS